MFFKKLSICRIRNSLVPQLQGIHRETKMPIYRCGTHLVITLTVFSLILCGLSGCAVVGPKSISMGRTNYNEAMDKTENEQMLMSIIKGRYGETFTLLSVSGVAANIRFAANANAQVGIGPEKNYLGGLVPLSGGLVYEENPTITYVPVQGEEYFQQLMSPIPLGTLVLFIRRGFDSAASLILFADRINDMQNPDFLRTALLEPDLRFQRFAELNEELYQEGIIQWVKYSGENIPYAILISDYETDHLVKVQEYMDLLSFSMPADTSENIVLPLYLGVKYKKTEGVAISTRSTISLIQILRATVEIPPEHLANGIAPRYPKPGPAGQGICIRTAKDKPDNAVIAVKYRGYWFYIDEKDTRTKRFYTIVRTLWSVSIATGVDQSDLPILTIPVN